ncbi:hypothetical protein H072_7854 [Dactylellina haptotyla CBS 200.50]|uniref:DNA mismatch repair protein S5 domain-containing protein n=1 Tax=Dactylellina haptotyla (strain CBS 200.50) TaxID=1284197 RepID=S8BGK2_DACHA|nr:hypothetical protein H072_7854 [Dactylellina haptotyla CBS 200.50]
MIHEIPQESIRRLGSSQVITDPITVIKELIENALDAGATSILVEASPDLISHIQVKDNGPGIDPSDRQLMARPNCTSKIVSFDDLLDVATLGFRGEALASLATVSGVLAITTRVKSESIAVAYEIAPDGSLNTITPVSAPVGCSVRVSNLFANFPVRKKTFEKMATKYLGQIRPLLLSYYLTHSKTRFQFKCVSGPLNNHRKKKIDPKYDVIFAASSTKEQAVIKAFGVEPCRNGQWVNRTEDKGDIEFEAFLVKANADTSPVSRKGVCVAYKGRPLSTTRTQGLGHLIYSSYKKQIKALFAGRSIESPTEPLLFLNILSSAGKVDVNIEPSKDDVLFESNERVVSNIKEFFEELYQNTELVEPMITRSSNSEIHTMEPNPPNWMGQEFTSEDTDYSNIPSDLYSSRIPRKLPAQTRVGNRLLGENRTQIPSSSPPIKTSSSATKANETFKGTKKSFGGGTGDTVPQEQPKESNTLEIEQYNDVEAIQGISKSSTWNFNMYSSGFEAEDDDDEFIDIEEILHEKERKQHRRDEDTRTDNSLSNPWTISKMNARVVPQDRGAPTSQTTHTLNKSPKKGSLPYISWPRISESQSPRQANILEARSCSDVFIAAMSTPAAPIPKMSKKSGPWYPGFGKDNTGSQNKSRNSINPKINITDEQGLSSPARQNHARSEDTQMCTRQSNGPLDNWVSTNQNSKAAGNPLSEDGDEEDDITLPPSVFFGKPDLRMSGAQGDGGRGLFNSGADRMRRQQDQQNAHFGEDEDEDLSSFSEDNEPTSNTIALQQENGQSLVDDIRLRESKLSYAPTFFNRLYTTPTKKSRLSNKESWIGMEDDCLFPPSSLFVTSMPRVDIKILCFRARLINDNLYDDEYDMRPPLVDTELDKIFTNFLRRYVKDADYQGDGLELLQQGITNGEDFDIKFQNLAGD